MKKIIYLCTFAVAVILIIQACNEDKTNVTKQDNPHFIVINEPYANSFSAIVGFLTAKEGPLLNIFDRALITYPDGRVDYYVSYTRIDNSVGSISFKIVGVVNNTPYLIASASYYECNQDEDLNWCMSGCRLDRPTDHNPLYLCYCGDSEGKGVNACSLDEKQGPEQLNDFLGSGNNILNTLPFSNLIMVNL